MGQGWTFAIGITLLTVAAMEFVALALHKYVMHGPGWGWHRSHHEPGEGWFERNDLYAFVFAGISLLLFTVGAAAHPALYWVAVGTAVYGLLYFLVHDGLVHRRMGRLSPPRVGYLKRLYQAHRIHHAVKGRTGCVSFGFLYAPRVDELKRKLRERGA